MELFVFSDNGARLAEFCNCARNLYPDSAVSAVVIGTQMLADEASKYAEQVYYVEKADETVADDYIPTVISLVKENNPILFLTGSSVLDRAVAGRLAAALDTSAVASAKTIEHENGNLVVSHVIYGGAAIRKERSDGKTLVVSASAGLFDSEGCKAVNGEVIRVKAEVSESGLKLLRTVEKSAGNSGVTTAKRVVGVGRGFSTADDIELAKHLAKALDGEVGYSRPVTEMEPPIAEGEPYIGVSGIQIKPDLYLALAISGQTQHVIGVDDSKVIVCINNDPNALMFRHSDYGIIADFREAVPTLIKILEK